MSNQDVNKSFEGNDKGVEARTPSLRLEIRVRGILESEPRRNPSDIEYEQHPYKAVVFPVLKFRTCMCKVFWMCQYQGTADVKDIAIMACSSTR